MNQHSLVSRVTGCWLDDWD